ncbi:uncharacterized protein BJX67DRAFT_307848 [Aspergillus lucknowensis]|uniref:Uncharacterized protein n=1 Tax=Aspergillus lucknowensis TaxID=176173 RepID=A0ABR4M167_9EURO
MVGCHPGGKNPLDSFRNMSEALKFFSCLSIPERGDWTCLLIGGRFLEPIEEFSHEVVAWRSSLMNSCPDIFTQSGRITRSFSVVPGGGVVRRVEICLEASRGVCKMFSQFQQGSGGLQVERWKKQRIEEEGGSERPGYIPWQKSSREIA